MFAIFNVIFAEMLLANLIKFKEISRITYEKTQK